ncbi:hypothetical protein HMPREF1987_02186 [Peptostreptococcaceae bacterium oral taxon 113 str. W5053]|nr:hypothetical protein HMPREF1987_02186 [Peptostreptococcaceae bacterium oral taxon 113 str. W5053]
MCTKNFYRQMKKLLLSDFDWTKGVFSEERKSISAKVRMQGFNRS